MSLFNETLNGKESKNIPVNRNGQKTALSDASKAEAIQGWLIDKLAAVLEIEPNQIDVRQDFEEYGLESAEAINLSGDLEDFLGCRLPPTLLWDYQNIEALAQYLANGNLTQIQANSNLELNSPGIITDLSQISQINLAQDYPSEIPFKNLEQ